MRYLAHKRNDTDGKEELLIDHLNQTAEMAAEFAKSFGYEKIAYEMGKLHDIGKYSEKFQRRINGENITVNHSTAGAITACKHKLVMTAFCISGHHGGLPDFGSRYDMPDSGTFLGKVNDKSIENYSAWETEQPDFEKQIVPEVLKTDEFKNAFLIHMLFSCLVDSDFICTERFMLDDTVSRGGYDDIPVLLERLNAYTAKWGTPTKELNILRSEIQKQCIAAKDSDENLLSLTVPTGGGKTISSLAFALNYAVQDKHKRKRVIYVIPYTSIIEQNAAVFKDALGAENVVEHHSNVTFDPKKTSSETVQRQQLACENWDAPVIVTTAVQFFESLFSNKPSKSRKLHNISDSVIIFDEAQMLPIQYLVPCVKVINELTEICNSTAVLCTATQPSLDKFFGECKGLSNYKIPEICRENPEKYAEKFRRTEFVYDGNLDDDELVFRLQNEEQVLCVVNKKEHAKKLFSMLGESEENICLSTHEYPAHRKRSIEKIRNRLNNNLPCKVISTSLIEAGVDLDFKTVYRAISGIDSILQAGGRCNREGKNNRSNSLVHIFDTGEIISCQQKNASVARKIIEKYGSEIYTATAIREYFDELYYYLKSGNDDDFNYKNIVKKYQHFQFKTVANDFKMIDDNAKTVYIPTEDNKSLISELRNKKYTKNLFRELEQYAVNLYLWEFEKLDGASAIEIVDDEFFILADSKYYSEKTGIIFPDSGLGMGLFVGI